MRRDQPASGPVPKNDETLGDHSFGSFWSGPAELERRFLNARALEHARFEKFPRIEDFQTLQKNSSPDKFCISEVNERNWPRTPRTMWGGERRLRARAVWQVADDAGDRENRSPGERAVFREPGTSAWLTNRIRRPSSLDANRRNRPKPAQRNLVSQTFPFHPV